MRLTLLLLSGCLVFDPITAAPIVQQTPVPITDDPPPTGATGATMATGSSGPTGATGSTAWTGPELIGYTTFSDANPSATQSDIVCALPTGATEGDFLLWMIASDHPFDDAPTDQADFEAAGWTLFFREVYGTDSQGTYLAYQFLGPTAPTSFLLTNINVDHHGVQALLRAYRHVSTDLPIESIEKYVRATGFTGVSDITTPTPETGSQSNNALAIAGLAPDQKIDGPTVTTWPTPFDLNRITLRSPADPTNSWASLYTAEARLPEPIAIPASAFTWQLQTASEYTGVLSFVLVLKGR